MNPIFVHDFGINFITFPVRITVFPSNLSLLENKSYKEIPPLARVIHFDSSVVLTIVFGSTAGLVLAAEFGLINPSRKRTESKVHFKSLHLKIDKALKFPNRERN